MIVLLFLAVIHVYTKEASCPHDSARTASLHSDIFTHHTRTYRICAIAMNVTR